MVQGWVARRASFRTPGRGRNKYRRYWAKQRVHRERKTRGETAESIKKRKTERRVWNKKTLQTIEADASKALMASTTRAGSALSNGAPACPPSHTKLETLTKAMVDELRRNVVVAKEVKGNEGGVDGGRDAASGHSAERYVLRSARFW